MALTSTRYICPACRYLNDTTVCTNCGMVIPPTEPLRPVEKLYLAAVALRRTQVGADVTEEEFWKGTIFKHFFGRLAPPEAFGASLSDSDHSLRERLRDLAEAWKAEGYPV